MEGEDYMDVMEEFNGFFSLGVVMVLRRLGGKRKMGNVFEMKEFYFVWGMGRVDCNPNSDPRNPVDGPWVDLRTVGLVCWSL